MKVDTTITQDLAAIGSETHRIEHEGYDGAWVGETSHDPFLIALQAANATSTLDIGTSIAIAFARTPMTLANVSFDLQRYTQGRFILGLGSQVKPHIERRFSMPWSHPAPRMRELVLGIRAIWDTWQNGTPLQFQGEFYTHTLMTPFFSPPPLAYPLPPIYLAGVGQFMTEVAGEVADGFFFHPFTTMKYMQEVTLPALQRGAEKAGKSLQDIQICGPAFAAVGRDTAELDAAIQGTKKQIAFYASTPAYRGVMDMHGWGDTQPELTRMSKQGQWDDMADLITDEMLDVFAVVGNPDEVGRGLGQRLGPVASRISLYANYESDPAIWPTVADAVRKAAG
jgi:probable F420-dependent oxidoreductase